jgi:hypothetical protein
VLKELLHHAPLPYILILDIGSGSVGVSIAEVDRGEKKPLIIYTYRALLRVAKKKSQDEFIRILKEALLEATLDFSSNGMKRLAEHDSSGHIDTIHVVYASPWSELVARHIHVEKDEPMRVTDDLIQTIVQEAEKQAASATHEMAIFETSGLSVIKKDVVDAKLNGYPVHEFTGQKCVSIEVTLLAELVPQIVRDAMSESEKNLIAHAHVIEHTSAKILAHGSQKMYADAEDILTIEITGEATECAVMKHGVVYENFFTLFGTHTFERELASSLGTIPDEARSHLKDYASNTSHEEVEGAVQTIRTTYKEELKTLLHSIESKYALPQRVLMLVDPLYREMYSTLVEEVYALMKADYKFFTVDDQLLDQFVEYGDDIEHDQYAALAALFFHTEHNVLSDKPTT